MDTETDGGSRRRRPSPPLEVFVAQQEGDRSDTDADMESEPDAGSPSTSRNDGFVGHLALLPADIIWNGPSIFSGQLCHSISIPPGITREYGPLAQAGPSRSATRTHLYRDFQPAVGKKLLEARLICNRQNSNDENTLIEDKSVTLTTHALFTILQNYRSQQCGVGNTDPERALDKVLHYGYDDCRSYITRSSHLDYIIRPAANCFLDYLKTAFSKLSPRNQRPPVNASGDAYAASSALSDVPTIYLRGHKNVGKSTTMMMFAADFARSLPCFFCCCYSNEYPTDPLQMLILDLVREKGAIDISKELMIHCYNLRATCAQHEDLMPKEFSHLFNSSAPGKTYKDAVDGIDIPMEIYYQHVEWAPSSKTRPPPPPWGNLPEGVEEDRKFGLSEWLRMTTLTFIEFCSSVCPGDNGRTSSTVLSASIRRALNWSLQLKKQKQDGNSRFTEILTGPTIVAVSSESFGQTEAVSSGLNTQIGLRRIHYYAVPNWTLEELKRFIELGPTTRQLVANNVCYNCYKAVSTMFCVNPAVVISLAAIACGGRQYGHDLKNFRVYWHTWDSTLNALADELKTEATNQVNEEKSAPPGHKIRPSAVDHVSIYDWFCNRQISESDSECHFGLCTEFNNKCISRPEAAGDQGTTEGTVQKFTKLSEDEQKYVVHKLVGVLLRSVFEEPRFTQSFSKFFSDPKRPLPAQVDRLPINRHDLEMCDRLVYLWADLAHASASPNETNPSHPSNPSHSNYDRATGLVFPIKAEVMKELITTAYHQKANADLLRLFTPPRLSTLHEVFYNMRELGPDAYQHDVFDDKIFLGFLFQRYLGKLLLLEKLLRELNEKMPVISFRRRIADEAGLPDGLPTDELPTDELPTDEAAREAFKQRQCQTGKKSYTARLEKARSVLGDDDKKNEKAPSLKRLLDHHDKIGCGWADKGQIFDPATLPSDSAIEKLIKDAVDGNTFHYDTNSTRVTSAYVNMPGTDMVFLVPVKVTLKVTDPRHPTEDPQVMTKTCMVGLALQITTQAERNWKGLTKNTRKTMARFYLDVVKKDFPEYSNYPFIGCWLSIVSLVSPRHLYRFMSVSKAEHFVNNEGNKYLEYYEHRPITDSVFSREEDIKQEPPFMYRRLNSA